jgi:hypothetical protein
MTGSIYVESRRSLTDAAWAAIADGGQGRGLGLA